MRNRLFIYLLLMFSIVVKAQITQTPGALPKPNPRPSAGTSQTPGAQSKTPINTYVLGLGAVAILFVAGYSRRYYHSK